MKSGGFFNVVSIFIVVFLNACKHVVIEFLDVLIYNKCDALRTCNEEWNNEFSRHHKEL